MEVTRNPRDTCVEPDEQSHEKLISSGVRCILVVIGVLTLALTVFSGFAVSLSVKAGKALKWLSTDLLLNQMTLDTKDIQDLKVQRKR